MSEHVNALVENLTGNEGNVMMAVCGELKYLRCFLTVTVVLLVLLVTFHTSIL